MRTMLLKVFGIRLTRDADYESKPPTRARLHSRDGIFNDDGPCRFNAQQFCRFQEGIRGGFPGQVLRPNCIAVDAYLEESVQLSRLQHGRAVLARCDDGDFESTIAELVDKSNASLVRLYSLFFNKLVDQLVLAIPETTDGFQIWRIVRGSLGELDIARGEKVANPIEAWLAIHVQPVIRGDFEGAKRFPSLCRPSLQIRVKHVFPTFSMQVGGVRYYAVEVKKDGIVTIPGQRMASLGLLH